MGNLASYLTYRAQGMTESKRLLAIHLREQRNIIRELRETVPV